MDTPNHENNNILIELVADIVASYVAHNSVPSNELSGLISNVYSAMASIGRNPQAEIKHQEPAVSVKKSITADYLICLEDGKKFKSLKRHLRTKYDLSPEDYRAKWALPADYPMVAPNYATARSNLALAMGLGQKRQANAGRKKASKA
ncbi:MAG: MucR family transcriptional regulator [Beijerinckiaceae bacterium]|jgi:predicted transcriptional regulator